MQAYVCTCFYTHPQVLLGNFREFSFPTPTFEMGAEGDAPVAVQEARLLVPGQHVCVCLCVCVCVFVCSEDLFKKDMRSALLLHFAFVSRLECMQ